MRTIETAHTDNGSNAMGHMQKTDLQEIKLFMERHYNEQLTIGQLAEMANISPKYFVDLFKRTFGQSAMEFLTGVRIMHAKRLLAGSGERLREIAQKVGYKDEFYFSRKFKKEVGVSPSDFAKNSKRLVAVCQSSAIGHLLPLGIIPEAAPLDTKWSPYYYNLLSGKIKTHLLLTDPYHKFTFEINLDKLCRARPDVIIASDQMKMRESSKLNSIAPIHIVPGKAGWRDQLMGIARFLNKEELAQQWIDRYEKNVKFGRAQTTRTLGRDRVIALRIYQSQIFVYRNRGLEEVLYDDLQIRPAFEREQHSLSTISMEGLQELNPERILLAVCPEASSRKYWLSLQHSLEWRQLQAVRNGHVHPITADPWFEYSAVAIARMLDEALLLFTGNCPNTVLDNSYGESFAT